MLTNNIASNPRGENVPLDITFEVLQYNLREFLCVFTQSVKKLVENVRARKKNDILVQRP